MTRIAVLSKKRLTSHRYDRWLVDSDSDSDCEVVLFAEDNPDARKFLSETEHGFAEVRLFPDWKQNRAIDMSVLTEHRRRPFDRLIALSECDVIRAAELRERLDLPGQRTASADAFRDKVVMKSLAKAAGIPVPEYQLVDTVSDLMDFVANHRTAVVKPLDGAGSAGVAVLAGTAAAEEWARARGLTSDDPARLIVEEWIAAPMLSLDGILGGGRAHAVMVGAYTQTCLSSLTDGAPHGILLLDPTDGRVPTAIACLGRLLAALPDTDALMSFHCELFDVPGGEPVLCEIACRTGGGNINRIAREVLGLDLEEASCRGQAGLPIEVPHPVPRRGRLLGDLVLPHPGRPLLAEPGLCPIRGVLDLTVHRDLAARDMPASKVSEYVVDALFESPDHAGLRQIFDEVSSWLGRELVWAEGDGRTTA